METLSRKRLLTIVLSSAAILAVILAAAAPAPAATVNNVVRLSESAAVAGGRILLGEIAAITCEDPAMLSGLREVAIGKSPLPGKKRRIDQDYIRMRLKQNGFVPEAISLQGPERVYVERLFNEVPREQIETVVEALKEHQNNIAVPTM